MIRRIFVPKKSYKNRGKRNRFYRIYLSFFKIKKLPLYNMSDFKTENIIKITDEGRFQWNVPL